MGYILPYDLNNYYGYPNLEFPLSGGESTEDIVEALAHTRRSLLNDEPFRGLLRGGQLTNESVEMIIWILVMGLTRASLPKAAAVAGAVGTLLKLGVKNPWIARHVARHVVNAAKPIVTPVARRLGSQRAGQTLNKLANVPAIKYNPVYKTLVDSGATIFRVNSLQNKLIEIDNFLDRPDIDWDEIVEDLQDHMQRTERMRTRGRTAGERFYEWDRGWFPKKRRKGYAL